MKQILQLSDSLHYIFERVAQALLVKFVRYHEKFTKNCQHQAVWFGWGILECFLQISPPDCNLECWSFFYSLRVFCAVILNTINPYFLTIFFWVPPLAKKISDANPPISKYFFSKKNLVVLLLCIKTTQKKFKLIKKVKILIFTTTYPTLFQIILPKMCNVFLQVS